MLFSLLVFLGFSVSATVLAHVGDGVDVDYSGRALQGDSCGTVDLWTITEVEDYDENSKCLVVLYDTVYDLKDFANIHRGGSWSITRNCGYDATFGYESLVCIPGVPDHTRGILNMVHSAIVGVIKGSEADPCANPDPDPIPDPNFDDCTVYDALKCEHLLNMPNGGTWNMGQVNATASGCVVALYGYVYDLGSPPQSNPTTPPNSGDLTFANKHGGGSQAILDHCREDITDLFETLVDMPGTPDHTKGSMNAILSYLVGVIEDSDVNPCVNAPPEPTCNAGPLTHYTMVDVQSATSGCVMVVMDRVYDLQVFAPSHYGGRSEILERCRKDITADFFEKSFHTLVQLGAIQQFQIGVIDNGMADPCGDNYDPNPDGGESGGTGDSDDSDDDDDDSDDDDTSPSPAPFLCSRGVICK